MKKIFLSITVVIIALYIVFLPVIAEAAGIVPNCRHTVNGRTVNACTYTHLIQLGINLMQFAIYIMTLFSVLSFVYAGYLYMSSGGDSGAIKKAHQVFQNVALGIFFTLGAWLIVHQITVWLGVKSTFTLLQ